MHTYVFEGQMTALTSISHIGETHGITSLLRREKVVQPDGTSEEVPIISGNSIRGILRDRGMLHMLRTLGYGANEQTGAVTGLSLAAFYFLFSGGALTKDGPSGLDVDEARKWRGLIPLVSVFGGAMGNQIMPGKVRIGKAIPICAETAHLLPARFVNGGTNSIWDMVQREPYTRRDDEKNENLRQIIAPKVRALLEASAADKRAKVRSGADEVAEGQHQQMRYYVETFAAGTTFFWDIALDDVADVEFDAFCITLAEFSRLPYLGGKSNVGHGKVSIKFDNWTLIDPRLTPTGTSVSTSLGTKYMDHLKAHGAEIKELIDAFA
jgi:CRISPR type IV-associated protein Csf2